MQHTCAHQREGDGKLGGEDEQRVGGLEAGNGGAEVPGKRHVGSARDACAARVGWGGRADTCMCAGQSRRSPAPLLREGHPPERCRHCTALHCTALRCAALRCAAPAVLTHGQHDAGGAVGDGRQRGQWHLVVHLQRRPPNLKHVRRHRPLGHKLQGQGQGGGNRASGKRRESQRQQMMPWAGQGRGPPHHAPPPPPLTSRWFLGVPRNSVPPW